MERKPTFNYTPEFIYRLLIAHLTAIALAVYLIWRGIPSWPIFSHPNTLDFARRSFFRQRINRFSGAAVNVGLSEAPDT